MPYSPVTVAMFKTRFPIFVDRSTPQLELILAEASARVDQSWKESDYQPAIMYLAAHLLVTDGSQLTDEEGGGPVGGGPIVGETFSGMSLTYAAPKADSSSSEVWAFYETTEYGRRFYRIMKLNFGGPVAV